MEKQKQAVRNQTEDAALNRILIWFGGAVVVEFLLLILNRYYINYLAGGISIAAAIHKALPIAIPVLILLAAACAFWLRSALKQGKRGLLAGLLTGIFAALAVGCGMAFQFQGPGIQFMCTLVPAVAVLALIYYLYQREFFAITLLSALGIIGLWLIRRAEGRHPVIVYGYLAVAAVVLVAALLLMRNIQKADGFLVLGRRKVRVLNHGVNYALFYVSCLVVAAALIASFALGLAAAYYLMFALVAWLFVLAVYFTVKLM